MRKIAKYLYIIARKTSDIASKYCGKIINYVEVLVPLLKLDFIDVLYVIAIEFGVNSICFVSNNLLA